jgi:hypothetical protein
MSRLEDGLVALYLKIRLAPEGAEAERADLYDFEMVTGEDSTGVTLSGKERAVWGEIKRAVSRGPWQEKLSEKYCTKKAGHLLAKVLDADEPTIRSMVRAMLKEFADYDVRQPYSFRSKGFAFPTIRICRSGTLLSVH